MRNTAGKPRSTTRQASESGTDGTLLGCARQRRGLFCKFCAFSRIRRTWHSYWQSSQAEKTPVFYSPSSPTLQFQHFVLPAEAEEKTAFYGGTSRSYP